MLDNVLGLWYKIMPYNGRVDFCLCSVRGGDLLCGRMGVDGFRGWSLCTFTAAVQARMPMSEVHPVRASSCLGANIRSDVFTIGPPELANTVIPLEAGWAHSSRRPIARDNYGQDEVGSKASRIRSEHRTRRHHAPGEGY